MINLDLVAAKTAQAIIADTTPDQKASEVDNLITKTLGVLQENGVYAATLYLYSRTSTSDKTIAKKTRQQLLSQIAELGLSSPQSDDPGTVLKSLTDNICNNLDRLLLVKQLWEQTLIYARYGAKARSVKEGMK